MQELFYIIGLERKTLLRGFLLSFALVFPFTFIPVLVREGFSVGHLLLRVPDSAVYTAAFSAFVTFMAVLQNYNKLRSKKYLYHLPAFEALNFYGRVGGEGSLVQDLSTFLVGKVGNYYFRVDIIDPEQKNFTVELLPFLDFEQNPALRHKIKTELKLDDDLHLSRRLQPNTEQLNDPDFLNGQLQLLASELDALGAMPADVAPLLDNDE